MSYYVTIKFDQKSLNIVHKLADSLFDGNRSAAVRHITKEWGKKRGK